MHMRLQASCGRHCLGPSFKARTAVVIQASGQPRRVPKRKESRPRQGTEPGPSPSSLEVGPSHGSVFEVGSVVTGQVLWTIGAGAKVQLALPDQPDSIVPMLAWLPTRQISLVEVSSAQDVFDAGDEVTAVILSVKQAEVDSQPNVVLGTRQLEAQPGDMLTDRAAVAAGAEERAAQWLQQRAVHMQEQQQKTAVLSRLQRGEVVTGVVDRIEQYGAFVRLEEGVTGLIHISQISHDRVAAVDKVFNIGDSVAAMVMSVDEGRGRLTLSTRKLEKTPGDMLRDPALVYETAEEVAAAYRTRLQSAAENADEIVFG